jgi:hypothetical protein
LLKGKIFGPKRDEVRGGWRKLHNLYSSPSIIRIIKSRRLRWAGHIAQIGEKRNVCRLLVGKPQGKRPLGRPRGRWVDNIKMGLLEIGVNVVDWIGLAQDRYRWRALVNAVMNLRVPKNAGKLSSDYTIGDLSGSVQLNGISTMLTGLKSDAQIEYTLSKCGICYFHYPSGHIQMHTDGPKATQSRYCHYTAYSQNFGPVLYSIENCFE